MRFFILAALLLCFSGCAGPAAILASGASMAVSTITEKTVTDHAVSIAMDQDCNSMKRTDRGGNYCVDWPKPADPDAQTHYPVSSPEHPAQPLPPVAQPLQPQETINQVNANELSTLSLEQYSPADDQTQIATSAVPAGPLQPEDYEVSNGDPIVSTVPVLKAEEPFHGDRWHPLGRVPHYARKQ